MSIPDSSGQAVANLTEITVRTDLTALEGNLEAVGGGVSAVRRAKRRPRCLWKWQKRGECIDMQFTQCVARSVAACNDCAGKPFALDKAAEDEAEAAGQLVAAACNLVDFCTSVSRWTKGGVEDNAVALLERLLAVSNGSFDCLIAILTQQIEWVEITAVIARCGRVSDLTFRRR